MITPAVLLGVLFLKPALVIAAAAAITAVFRRRSAATRHGVWAGAIVATVALPLLTGVIPPLRISAPFPAIEWTRPELARSGTGATAAGRVQAPTTPSPANGVPDPVQRRAASGEDRLALGLVSLWILGALLLGARRIVAEVRVRWIVGRAQAVFDPRLEELFALVARTSGVRRPVSLRLSDEITSPAVAGVLRPVVLLPAAAVSWGESDLAQVLIHELGHVSRRDSLLNVLADAATAFYWCNPAIRFAAGRMRAESEGACDDLVLGAGAAPERYAHLLLDFARRARLDGLPSAATAMARPRELESRLLAVLDPRVRRDPLPHWMPPVLATFGLVLALPVAALTLHAAPPSLQNPTAAEPDRRADSLAGPASERVPLAPERELVSRGAAEALAGSDSALARRLVIALDHTPENEGDLIGERAAWALAQTRGGRLVEPLLAALGAEDWRVRGYAAWALATARDPRTASPLIALLDHQVWRLRAMAAYALRELGSPVSQEAMRSALTDPAWQVRVEAVGYFAGLGGPDLSERIRPRLADRHVAVRTAAEQALTHR